MLYRCIFIIDMMKLYHHSTTSDNNAPNPQHHLKRKVSDCSKLPHAIWHGCYPKTGCTAQIPSPVLELLVSFLKIFLLHLWSVIQHFSCILMIIKVVICHQTSIGVPNNWFTPKTYFCYYFDSDELVFGQGFGIVRTPYEVYCNKCAYTP